MAGNPAPSHRSRRPLCVGDRKPDSPPRSGQRGVAEPKAVLPLLHPLQRWRHRPMQTGESATTFERSIHPVLLRPHRNPGVSRHPDRSPTETRESRLAILWRTDRPWGRPTAMAHRLRSPHPVRCQAGAWPQEMDPNQKSRWAVDPPVRRRWSSPPELRVALTAAVPEARVLRPSESECWFRVSLNSPPTRRARRGRPR